MHRPELRSEQAASDRVPQEASSTGGSRRFPQGDGQAVVGADAADLPGGSMIEIRHKQTGVVLRRIEAESLAGQFFEGAKLSGANLAGALEIAKTAPAGANILAMMADTGERYLSTPLFADIGADMSEEEMGIFNSTPYGRA